MAGLQQRQTPPATPDKSVVVCDGGEISGAWCTGPTVAMTGRMWLLHSDSSRRRWLSYQGRGSLSTTNLTSLVASANQFCSVWWSHQRVLEVWRKTWAQREVWLSSEIRHRMRPTPDKNQRLPHVKLHVTWLWWISWPAAMQVQGDLLAGSNR